jgi:DNA polymerase/3'-5' exonuclease PolX
VRELESVGFLTDHLTHPRPSDERSCVSYMGVCRFEEATHHRIDIKYYPIEEYAYAILHFTGSKAFNRMLRLHTMRLGLQLSDKGATPKMEKGVIWERPVPTCLTEQDIFAFLGLAYKAPNER